MIDRLCARLAGRGRWLLVGGLAVGLASPALAETIRPALAPLLAAILLVAMLRQKAPNGPDGWRAALRRAIILQCLLPLGVASGLVWAGVADAPWALALILILAAAPITGAGPLAAMAGADGSPALRQTIVGTLALPLTVLPVFALLPLLGDPRAVLGAAIRLALIIGAAAAGAMLIRPLLARVEPALINARLDALQAMLLAIVVVGIMGGAARALRVDPVGVLLTLAAVCVLVALLQALALAAWRGRPEAVSLAVATGNRNVALLLGALPDAVVLAVLPIIGAYQIPMYLTPLVLPLVLRRLGMAQQQGA